MEGSQGGGERVKGKGRVCVVVSVHEGCEAGWRCVCVCTRELIHCFSKYNSYLQ